VLVAVEAEPTAEEQTGHANRGKTASSNAEVELFKIRVDTAPLVAGADLD